MRPTTSLLGNTLVHGVASGGTVVLLFVLHIIAARFMGAEDYGRFSFAMAFAMLFAPILGPGFYQLLIREIARDKGSTSKYVSHALSWKLAAAPVAFLLIYLSVNVIHDTPRTLQTVYLMAIATILHSFKNTFTPALLAHERFGLNGISLIFERIALLVFSGIVLLSGGGLIGVCWTFIAVRTIDLAIISALVWHKIVHFRVGRNVQFTKQLLLAAIPIGAFQITLGFYNYVDTVMISGLRNPAEVGWYGAAYKLYEGLMILPVIIGTVVMPRISRLHVEDRDAFARLSRSGLQYVFLVALATASNGIIFADKMIIFFFGSDFASSIVAIEILFVGIVFAFTINFLQTLLISADRQNLVFHVAVAGLIMNVLLNAVLIPSFGYIGAAVATVLIEGVVFMILARQFLSQLTADRSGPFVGLALLAAIGLGALAWVDIPPGKVYLVAGAANIVLLLVFYFASGRRDIRLFV
jgi:O-antigen/teichoic acid export membrane protein